MNSEYLKYFIAACDEGSISKAAKNMYISAQGLGQAIHRLEKQIGLELLTQTGNKVIPTEFGKQFYIQAVKACSEIDQLEDLAKSYLESKHNTITLGTIGQTKFYIGMQDSIRRFNEKKPDSSLKIELIEQYESNELFRSVDEGIIDIGLMFNTHKYDKYEYYALSEYSRLMFLVCKDRPVASKSSVRTEELKDESIIGASPQDPFTDFVTYLCGTYGFKPNITYYSTENNMNARLIDNNISCMYIRESYAHRILRFCENAVAVPIEPRTDVALSFFWKKDRRFDAEKKLFIRQLTEHFNTIIK